MQSGNKVGRVGEGHSQSCRLRTNTTMLVPVLSLVFGRAVFDQPALATDQAMHGWCVCAVSTALRTLGTLATVCISLGLLAETDIAIDPVAHFLCFNLLPVPTTTLYGQNCCSFDTSSRKADHFTIVVTAGVGTPAREVEEDFFCGYEERMREKNLRV